MNKKLQDKIISELRKGMSLSKCRKCGCMKSALENIDSSDMFKDMADLPGKMATVKYDCLGCRHCYAAEAANIFNEAFLERAAGFESAGSICEPAIKKQTWPPAPGEYFVLCGSNDTGCPVAVSTLGSIELAKALARNKPEKLCIVGKTETENIGIDKIIKNTITNPAIRVLLLAGKDPEGHFSGKTLIALQENGVDENMRVIGSPGRRPVLKNVTRAEIDTFRRQVKVIDMIECENIQTLVEKIKESASEIKSSYDCQKCGVSKKTYDISAVPKITAEEPARVELDKAGYFVILPQPGKKNILAEHYSNDNTLLRIIEGNDAKSIYLTIINSGWITQMSHCAYLGKELAKAEYSIQFGIKYVQDGA